MNIKLIKLVTGEEIIADTTVEDGIYKLSKSVMFMFQPEQGTGGFAPFPMFAKKNECSIAADHVIYVVEPEDELLNMYNAKFGSGLVLAGNPGLQVIT